MSEPNIPDRTTNEATTEESTAVPSETAAVESTAVTPESPASAAAEETTAEPADAKNAPKVDGAAMARRALAEFAGSFFVCFALFAAGTYGTVLYGANVVFVAVIAALAYGAAAAAFSRISGGHFNPAVTLAAALTSRIGWLDALAYVVAQLLGGIVAGALTVAVLPTSGTVGAKVWLASAVNGFGEGSPSNSMLSQAGISFNMTMAIVVEVAMGLLVVAAAMNTLREDGSPSDTHTVATAVSYGVASAVAFPITGAGLNPVRSTGIALFAQGKGLTVEPLQQLWVFWVCPLLAGAVVALVMLLVDTMRQKAEAASLPAEAESTESYAAADSENAGDATETASETEGDATVADEGSHGSEAPAKAEER
ncbi:MIP/aquaporin family protein [Bifidobacterium simiarum]|uniref:MIP/aquaporin family protein n=1 Tax=Bifidobacterium simiarum TaxID=2045441 RepID=UPI001BDD32E6|nr:aquaporin [Bifidobacterium simiarum]MBT1166298.1 aquaporin [Bifidobacterium simiarum]